MNPQHQEVRLEIPPGRERGGNIAGRIFLRPARQASRRRSEPLGGKSGA